MTTNVSIISFLFKASLPLLSALQAFEISPSLSSPSKLVVYHNLSIFFPFWVIIFCIQPYLQSLFSWTHPTVRWLWNIVFLPLLLSEATLYLLGCSSHSAMHNIHSVWKIVYHLRIRSSSSSRKSLSNIYEFPLLLTQASCKDGWPVSGTVPTSSYEIVISAICPCTGGWSAFFPKSREAMEKGSWYLHSWGAPCLSHQYQHHVVVRIHS